MGAQSVSSQAQSASAASVDSLDVRRIPQMVKDLRASFDSGKTRPIEWRQQQLGALARLVRENETAIDDALRSDLGRPAQEAFLTEISHPLGEIAHTRKHLKKWMAPERVTTPVALQPGASYRYKDPLGVVLIVAPWNYPFDLCVGPLIGAIAAGNCAVMKPSEMAPATSALVARLVPKYLDTQCFRVVEGAIKETTALLEERFDHIFYTGNGTVGRIVMTAAAKHLTPVTLELGGKSPCIIDKDCDIDLAARRITWGKWTNAGQTCVAPDYVLVHEAVHDRLLDAIKKRLHESYGDDPQKNPDYGRIINERHHQRVAKLIPSGEVVVGGQSDAKDKYIAPTVLKNVSPDSPVMAEEIFGPVLPVLKIKSAQDAVRFVNARPKPLALYVFSNDTAFQEEILTQTSSGGVTINHAWLHLGNPHMPFGGVGESGMGGYHGRFTFDTFTHFKSVLKKKTSLEPDLMYPPYSENKVKWLKRLV
jgi:aldehyde dehydrogenase (NAD+)